MASHSLAIPAFGKADLSNCEREEIHLAGSIQPHGALLVVSEPDHRVIQASANAAKFLNLEQVIGIPLADLDGASKIGRLHLAEALSYRALAEDVRHAA